MLWLGPSYRGHELQGVGATPADELPTDSVTGLAPAGTAGMVYGTCEIPPEQTEGGCAPPYELQERNACVPFPVAVGNPRLLPGPGNAVSYSEGGGVVVISGRTYVKLFPPLPPYTGPIPVSGGKRPAGARRVAAALRPLGESERSGPLPPPARCNQPRRFPERRGIGVYVCVPQGPALRCIGQGIRGRPWRERLPPWRAGMKILSAAD